ncbi:hypothetical protein [Vreelandella venusta]|uniref:hypothetical protein n=1 Tax=Vreelandella venusta TaxID=44935 RepID=UPI003F674423
MHEKEMVMPLTEDMCVGITYPPRNESFEERQLRLLESIDQSLKELVDGQRSMASSVSRVAVQSRSARPA